MIERFVFIGETEAEARRNRERTNRNFVRFHANLSANGRFSLPPSVQHGSGGAGGDGAAVGPPPDTVVVGTPDTVRTALQQTLGATGARRLMVETFSGEEMRLFAREVLPGLRRLGAPLVDTPR
jgi:alkanesulfonate monooxygenase SsuD/methylene tetrahydromethanopterin reductase-like flavin-dependent oxidoreductase (luciferase family)